MPTPSLYPQFMLASDGSGGGPGTIVVTGISAVVRNAHFAAIVETPSFVAVVTEPDSGASVADRVRAVVSTSSIRAVVSEPSTIIATVSSC